MTDGLPTPDEHGVSGVSMMMQGLDTEMLIWKLGNIQALLSSTSEEVKFMHRHLCELRRWTEECQDRERFKKERKIWAHYEHARENHPHFCDTLHWPDLGGDSEGVASGAYLNRLQNLLRNHKEFINASVASKECSWIELLDDEAYEVLEAVAKGDTAAAVEECYDAIAVLLRVIDVLEGRQQLGKPEDKP